MRRLLALAAALAAVVLAGGCVSVPADDAAPPPLPAPAAARTPSRLPGPVQASARTALVATGPSATPQRQARHRSAPQRRSAGVTGPRPPRALVPAAPRAGEGVHRSVRSATPRRAGAPRVRQRPARPVAPRRPAGRTRAVGPRPQPRPEPSYDLRTVCGWSHGAPVPPAVRGLCDAYVR